MNEANVTIGNFYFIENKYYDDFSDDKLMSKKEVVNGVEHNRPSFYSFIDKNTGIYWFIPISSQVKQFRALYARKMAKYKSVDTLVFGYVMGNERAFLIQNMFPIIPEYIHNEYIDSATEQPVIINEKLKAELNHKAAKVLMLQRRGYSLIFPNVLEIERQILNKNLDINY
jgi:hypothetical protein